MKQVVVKNISWIILGNGLAAAVAFVTAVVVSRVLSVADFGFFQLLYTYFIFVQALENFAHQNVLKSLFHDRPEDRVKIIVSSFWILFSIFFVLLVLAFIGAFLFRQQALLIFGCLLVGQIFRSLVGLSYYFDFVLDSLKTQISILLAGGISSVGRVITGILFQSLPLQGLSFSIGSLASIVSWLVSARSWFSFSDIFKRRSNDGSLFVLIAKSSFPLWLIAMLHLLLFKLDVIILGFLGKNTDIAIYSNAVRLTEPWSFIVGAFSSSFFPIFLQAKRKSTTAYYRTIGVYFRVLVYSSIILSILLSIFSYQIIDMLYGVRYHESGSVLRWHAYNLIPFFLVVGMQIFDVIESLKKFSVFKFVVSIAVAFTINVTLIPEFGVYACVFASFVSYMALGLVLNVFNKRYLRITIVAIMSLKDVKKDIGYLYQLIVRKRV